MGLLFIFVAISSAVGAQDQQDTLDNSRSSELSVYIDCQSCDYNHIRRQIKFVNYVRDPKPADIHLFITYENTGSGGRRYELTFIGYGDFNGIKYTLNHDVGREASADERREGLNEVIKIGLVGYVIQVSDPSMYQLEYLGSESNQRTDSEINDPWNYWVFRVYAGSLRLDLESNQKEFDSRWGFYADHVTDEWKIRFRPYFNYEYDEIDQEGEDAPITSRRHRHGINSYVIKSLNDHWSLGVFSDYLTRNDRNYRHRFRLTPGIEYNIFPYQQATRKSFTFTYRVGYVYADYYEQTIYKQYTENLLNQELSASVRIKQPWGQIQGGVEGSHYFHDFSQRRTEMFGDISVRLTEGLSLSFYTRIEMIQDQLSLPKGDTSIEDVLLQQKELATDYSIYGAISLSYTFGSDFANVVNTRF
ncbi:hypothetical protein [Fodinibius sp. Rm-B-1B1-1]|uniref:hypothetical protein n=1 Tax=Fodinibius alkaliphilus TaxID=3140241 RepID=UPI003159AE84